MSGIVRRRRVARLLAAVYGSACVLALAGCGSDDSSGGRASDPETVVQQAFRKTSEVVTGHQSGTIILRMSGPIKYQIAVAFEGPFDLTDRTQPAYDYDSTFIADSEQPKQLGLAAKGDTRYVTLEEENFSYRYGSARAARTPLGVIAREISGRLRDITEVPSDEGKPADGSLYRATLDPAVFRGSLVPIFNDLVQPGMRSTAIGGSRTEAVFGRAIQEAEATLGISDKGLLEKVRLRTNGKLAEGRAIATISIELNIRVTRQNEPVDISVPKDAKVLDTRMALEDRISDFIAGQYPDMALPGDAPPR